MERRTGERPALFPLTDHLANLHRAAATVGPETESAGERPVRGLGQLLGLGRFGASPLRRRRTISGIEDTTLADILLALAQQERASDRWDELPTAIPPAPASLAWMATGFARQGLCQ